jgi:hypothetical protein
MTSVPLHALGGLEVEQIAPDKFRLAGADGTRDYNLAEATRTVTGAASSAAVAFGALGESREVMLTCTERCYVAIGGEGVGAASGANAAVLPVAADEKFHLKLKAGETHYRVIRDSADGVFRAIPVA